MVFGYAFFNLENMSMNEVQRSELVNVASVPRGIDALRAATKNWPREWFDYAAGYARQSNPMISVQLQFLQAERAETLHQLRTLTIRRRCIVLGLSLLIVGSLAVIFF